MSELNPSRERAIGFSFEFFPPKTPEAEAGWWRAVQALTAYEPEFVSVTYGAGATSRAPTFAAVKRLLDETPLVTASHLTVVKATKAEVDEVVHSFRNAGVKRFVALRGDAPGGVGAAYQPHPGGYENGAALVAGLKAIDDFDISVSAYPEKHPESADRAADIAMLKAKADNGADRALTQFFFENDTFEDYLGDVRRAGIEIPVVPGIMPVQNIRQLRNFAGRCGAIIPDWMARRFEGYEDDATAHFEIAADLAAEQVLDLQKRGLTEFHFYTMNRSKLMEAVFERLGIGPRIAGGVAGAELRSPAV
ncbi:methylenetetrahydrofolate reductase [NAD(P)H] [Martelella endophytica]|uniref:Methylenetetrahydrofolate reductase n=1 Tax=Martelella endophytica TaxID=1486262 RepID=A0A0D5LRH2_MAREN|nr:methylenetetrahydrofolate reductase [NAD(P)H] [Martelella endophytica]AJY46731.1 5,10-methylenetetrahydrofolate reductase [Martelella endophytica]